MAETLTAPVVDNTILETMRAHYPDLEARFQREEFSLALVDKGMVSAEFYESGALDAFELNEKTGRDALTHLLVGDAKGGGHHLPTMMQLESEGVAVASKIADPNNPSRPLKTFRHEQKVQDNGAYRALDVTVVDPRTGRPLKKMGGSTMFPNEWSTQDVLQAVLEVGKTPGEYDQRRGSLTHQKKVNGILIRAATDKKTGKILTAYPVVRN